MSITQAQADAAIGAARAAALAIGVPMNIAVDDDGANLKAFARRDGALLGSLDIAMGKARTAALFGFNTEALYDFCKPGGASPGFENSNGGLVVAVFPSEMRKAGCSARSVCPAARWRRTSAWPKRRYWPHRPPESSARERNMPCPESLP